MGPAEQRVSAIWPLQLGRGQHYTQTALTTGRSRDRDVGHACLAENGSSKC
jgi:hypothetical protein